MLKNVVVAQALTSIRLVGSGYVRGGAHPRCTQGLQELRIPTP